MSAGDVIPEPVPDEPVAPSDMRPLRTADNVADLRMAYTVGGGEGQLSFPVCVSRTDLQDGISGESSICVAISPHDLIGAAPRPMPISVLVPTLRDHVSVVISVSAGKDVARPHTRRCIASVAAKQALGHGAILRFPSYDMCRHALTVHREVAIARTNHAASPKPTLAKLRHMARYRAILVHPSPELFHRLDAPVFSGTPIRTADRHSTDSLGEDNAALWACPRQPMLTGKVGTQPRAVAWTPRWKVRELGPALLTSVRDRLAEIGRAHV